MTDSELRTLIQEHPAQGHRALYEEYAQYAFAVIFRILRDCGTVQDAEDCLVETFAEVIAHIDCIRGGSLKAYIGKSAQNRALNLCRSLKRHRQNTVPFDSVPELAASHVQEDLEQKALQTELLQKIRALGEPDATILVQKYYYGRKMPEIAKMVGLSPHAAQVRCSRALKRLRKELEDWR